MNSLPSGARRFTATHWLIVSLAAIGFAFDIYELLMAQFIVRPAIIELTGHKPGSREFGNWAAVIFYAPAVAGGLFGLLGGYLTDRLGRRRVLTWSILIYAFSAFAAGFSTTIGMLVFFRSTTFVGVCVEFVAAVAWLAELFTDPHQRERVLGYTQAFSSFGGLLVAGVFGLAGSYSDQLPVIALPEWLNFWGGEIADGHAAWRYTLMSGIIPALPLILIRPFLPESPVWAEKRAAGTLRRPTLGAVVLAGPVSHHGRHHDHVRLQLRGRLRRHPAVAADRAGSARRAGRHRRQNTRPSGVRSRPRRFPPSARCRKSAGWWDALPWRCWRCESSRGGSCCGCFCGPG